MSGHSHFATIKHKKGLADAQRSKAFSKLAKEITIAAKAGPDPASNASLRTILEKAKALNMPSDNVERAIKKATGAGDANELQEILLEAYGPGGIALLIAGITDNKNRTLGEIKLILSKFGGKMVEGGAVQWLFERKGTITILRGEKTKEELELIAIEAGAEDLRWQDENTLTIFTKSIELEHVKKKLIDMPLPLEDSSLDWIAKEYVEAPENVQASTEKLFEVLDEQDDVQEIYSNLKISNS